MSANGGKNKGRQGNLKCASVKIYTRADGGEVGWWNRNTRIDLGCKAHTGQGNQRKGRGNALKGAGKGKGARAGGAAVEWPRRAGRTKKGTRQLKMTEESGWEERRAGRGKRGQGVVDSGRFNATGEKTRGDACEPTKLSSTLAKIIR